MEKQIIILLGAKLENGEATREMADRCACAFQRYRLLPKARILACGGITDGSGVSEASVMKRLLTGRGVPDEDIIIEDKSRMTAENIVNALKILSESERQSLLLVTSDYHMARAQLTLRRFGAHAIGCPVRTPMPQRLRKAVLEPLFIVDLLMGNQDPGARRPSWTRMIMRLLGQDKP